MSERERLEQIRQKVLWTTRNQGVNVKVNKLDFVFLLEWAETGIEAYLEPTRERVEAAGANGLTALEGELAPSD